MGGGGGGTYLAISVDLVVQGIPAHMVALNRLMVTLNRLMVALNLLPHT